MGREAVKEHGWRVGTCASQESQNSDLTLVSRTMTLV